MRLLVILFLLWAFNHVLSADESFSYIKRVVDGDTVLIDEMYALQNGVANTPVRVRLAHIDAPESSQKYGGYATTMLSKKCQGGYSYVSYSGKTGRYGRELGTLYCGVNVNLWLVEIGAAHPYTGAPREYFQAARDAIKNKRGMWQDEKVIHPKAWRDRKKTKPVAQNHKYYLEVYK